MNDARENYCQTNVKRVFRLGFLNRIGSKEKNHGINCNYQLDCHLTFHLPAGFLFKNSGI